MLLVDVMSVFLDPGIDGTAGLPSVDLTTFEGTVYTLGVVNPKSSFTR
jgi:hypothetical protein